ncbi:MAG: hypothetical protein AAFY64_10520, partial [Pseudomonadota bacterium]
ANGHDAADMLIGASRWLRADERTVAPVLGNNGSLSVSVQQLCAWLRTIQSGDDDDEATVTEVDHKPRERIVSDALQRPMLALFSPHEEPLGTRQSGLLVGSLKIGEDVDVPGALEAIQADIGRGRIDDAIERLMHVTSLSEYV